MTKKDFQLIAAVLAARAPSAARNAIAEAFADALATTNPLFKRELFIQAATGQVAVTARKAKPAVEDPDRDNTTFYDDDVDECSKCGGDKNAGDCDCELRIGARYAKLCEPFSEDASRCAATLGRTQAT